MLFYRAIVQSTSFVILFWISTKEILKQQCLLPKISVLQRIAHMISFKHITTHAAYKHTNVCMSDKNLNEYSGTGS